MSLMPASDAIQFAILTSDRLATIQSLEKESADHPWSARQIADAYTHGYIIHTFSLESSPDQVVGYWILQQVIDELHLLNFTIARGYQSLGIGSRVLSCLVRQYRDDVSNETLIPLPGNASIKQIELEVRASNIAAQRVYEKCGFTKTGERQHYYRNGAEERENAILMRCIISD